MVIAADEGIMPQTREHMEICSLLDIQHGLVVLTKADLVDEEWLDMVRDEVHDFVSDTFLEGAPIIPVSSATGEGITDFLGALEKVSAKVTPKITSGLFRLPVDRVFTMKGFGTVITGTLISGKVKVGEVLEIYSNDSGTRTDVPAWAKKVGHDYLGIMEADGYDKHFVRRQK
jgi:selenocysteine-specific elongation factor